LKEANESSTVLTNIMTGRPARGIVNRLIREQGPIAEVPGFPNAANALAPLRAAAEKAGSGEFSPLWSGQAAGLGRALPAGEFTRTLAAEALKRLTALGTAARKS
jgi:nitronate monooxygenase